MAKMKVHELAKELQKQSKEILAFLQEQGIEAKAPQSTLEEDTVALVRKSFGADTGKTEEKKAAPVKEENAKAQTAPARDQGTEEAPKKKKKIIIVSNNNGSNNFSSQRPGNNRPGQGGNGRQGNNGGNRQNRPAQETHHRIIKPLTAPSMPDTMKPDFKQNARRMEEERNAARNQARREAEAAAAESAQRRPAPSQNQNQSQRQTPNQNQGQRQTPNQNQQSREQAPASQQGREERYQRNERSQEQRPQRNDGRGSFSGNRPNNAGGRNDFRRDGAPSNGSRPSGSNGRPERSNGGQDNRFKKPDRQGKGFMADTPIKDAEKHRDEEKRRNSQERDKKSKKDFMYEEDETALKNKNKAGRFIKPEKKEEEPEEQMKGITLPESLTIKDLADKMKLQPSAIIKKLFLQGQIVTVNTEISYEEAENIAIDYDIICEQEVKVDVIEELLKEDEEKEEDLERRPPVICVMGHVDHGKTSLLDAIRKTNVTDKEAGGITQHIGAYTVNVKGQSITFLDTPGHEAFAAMRMRGANSTDIAILVVPADDCVMPQTVEAINHAKAAGIEIIVAVNKIDKPGANIDKVKQEMTEYELIPVDWGGSTEFVPVSAKSGEGIDTLLETILLTAEIMELKANPHRRARGLVIEAELDKGR